MVVAMKKLRKLRNRHFLRFTSISVFAAIVLAKIHPALTQTTENTVVGNSMDIALATNILEMAAGLLVAISLVLAMLGAFLKAADITNQWKALGISLLG